MKENDRDNDPGPDNKKIVQAYLEELKEGQLTYENEREGKKQPQLQKPPAPLQTPKPKKSKLLIAGLIIAGIIVIIGIGIPLVLIGTCFYEMFSGSNGYYG